MESKEIAENSAVSCLQMQSKGAMTSSFSHMELEFLGQALHFQFCVFVPEIVAAFSFESNKEQFISADSQQDKEQTITEYVALGPIAFK